MRKSRFDIPKIKYLYFKKHLTTYEIAEKIGCNQTTVQRIVNPDSRETHRKYIKKYHRTEKWKKYSREYHYNRYHTDEEFRRKHIEAVKRGRE